MKKVLFTFLVIGLGVGVGVVQDVQEQRSSELQKDILALQGDIKKLEAEYAKDSQGKLEKDKILGLKKDIVTLKKESFASQDATWLLLFQSLGTVGVLGGLWITWNGQSLERENSRKTFEDAENRLASDRFTKAVELLGTSSSSGQLGGIYTLENIANNHETYKVRAITTLTDYIKDQVPSAQVSSNSSEVEDLPTGLNIKVALEVIQKIWKDLQQEKVTPRFGLLDLNHTCWRNMDIPFGSHWEYLQVENSFLHKVNFRQSNLTFASFSQSILTGVKFGAATLDYASFRETQLEEIEFTGTNLESTNFIQANLKNVDFRGANLKNAVFRDAILEAVNFKGVQSLKDAEFQGAKLQGAIFRESHRQEADFSGADLTDVIFEIEDSDEVEPINQKMVLHRKKVAHKK